MKKRNKLYGVYYSIQYIIAAYITIIFSVFLKRTHFFFFVRVRLDGMIQSLINTKLVK